MASEHKVRELGQAHLADGRRLQALADMRQLILSLSPADRTNVSAPQLERVQVRAWMCLRHMANRFSGC